MKIVTAITPKGGPGKTTLLFSLAKYLHDTGAKVLVLDPDSNNSFSGAYERRIEFFESKGLAVDFPTVRTFVPSKAMLERQIRREGEGFDYVLVDTFGLIEKFQKELVLFVDFVAIPVQPNQSSVNNAIDTAEYLTAVQAENDGYPVFGATALSFSRTGTIEREYLKDIEQMPVFSAKTRPYQKAYTLADRRGLAVVEMADTKSLSKQEQQQCENAAFDMRKLCKEITSLLEQLA